MNISRFLLHIPLNKKKLIKNETVAASVRFITGLEQTQLKSAIFISLVYSIIPQDITIQNLFNTKTASKKY